MKVLTKSDGGKIDLIVQSVGTSVTIATAFAPTFPPPEIVTVGLSSYIFVPPVIRIRRMYCLSGVSDIAPPLPCPPVITVGGTDKYPLPLLIVLACTRQLDSIVNIPRFASFDVTDPSLFETVQV